MVETQGPVAAVMTNTVSTPPISHLPVVTVVIPTRGTKPRQLATAVRSVLAQSRRDEGFRCEVIVALDGPEASVTDADLQTAGLCPEERAALQSDAVRFVRLLPASGGRPGRVRNAALREVGAGTAFVAFLDDDDR